MNKNIKKKKYILFGVFLFIFIILFSLIWLNFFKKTGKDVAFEVQQGESTRQVAKNLHEKNLIFSPTVFSLFVYSQRILLQPGQHSLTSSMNMLKIIKSLSLESSNQSVTIPEGYRLTQIDELLSEKELIEPGQLTKIAAVDEGSLFPDTYSFQKNMTVAEIRQTMLDNFNKKTEDLSGGKVTKNVLIIASIVEREAKFDEDRARIAGVYWSRLDIGMKLEADPTIQYGKGSWDPITVADYKNFISPYNTYLHEGLPPTPICNPGLKSIEAALLPVKDGSLFFFTQSDGHAVFSKTYVEHLEKLKK